MAAEMNWSKATKEAQQNDKRERGTDMIEQNIVGTYLNALHRFPQLKHEEVVDLFQRYVSGCTRDEEGEVVSRTPDADRIRKRLTECNLRLVVSIAKQYKGHNLPIEDLIQEGNIGLMKAVDRFKWEK